MRLHFLCRLILIAVLIIVSGFVENNYAMTREENRIIYPGKGVGPVRINETMPAGLPVFMETAIKDKRIEIEFFPNKTVKKLIISSESFFVAVSALRIGQNNKGDIIRFYGEVRSETIANNKIVLRYPSRGIDFEIDRFSERITAIIIYMPAERPRLPESKYRQYREQFKQMKQQTQGMDLA
jgi:hypothetical protein